MKQSVNHGCIAFEVIEPRRHLSNAFLVRMPSTILYFLFSSFSLKGRVVSISGKYCHSNELFPERLPFEAVTTKLWFLPRARTLKT